MSAEPLPPTQRNASLPPASTNGQGAPRGTVYLLHFDQRYQHAGHYTGWADDLDQRLAAHQRGAGARLVEVITRAGIGFRLARIWPGASRARERSLKNSGGAARRCPICKDERAAQRESRSAPTRGHGRGEGPGGRPVRGATRQEVREAASAAVPTRGVRPGRAREFMALNPSFARPVSASLAVKWGRVRGREEIEALGPRVTGARFDENQPLFQQRVAAITRRAVQARVQARQRQLADQAEQTRTRAVAARAHQRLANGQRERPGGRPAQRDRHQQSSDRREGGHER